MKCYIKIDVNNNLPENSEYYYVYLKEQNRKDFAWFNKGQQEFEDWREQETFEHINIEFWLKEIDFSELMIDFAKYYYGSEWPEEVITMEEGLNKFLTLRGIITIE